jgi:DNA-directed RNA polymerase I, II, and III subunit RPABC3
MSLLCAVAFSCVVSRLRCRGENTDAECTLDVNVDIYPLKSSDKVMFALSSTLAEDGKPDDGTFDQARPSFAVRRPPDAAAADVGVCCSHLLPQSQRKSMLDKFEYVMYGKRARGSHSSALPCAGLSCVDCRQSVQDH